MNREEIAQIMKMTRIKLGWSQEYAAEIIDVSDRNIRDFEHANTNLQLYTLLKMCHHYGLELMIQPMATKPEETKSENNP